MNLMAQQTAAEFSRRFGYSPAGVWSAPGRVNLIGEHTDYNEGFVLPFAINRRTYAAIGLRSDGQVRVSSAFANEPVQISLAEISPDASLGWAAYPLGMAWALRQLATEAATPVGVGPLSGGFDCFFESDVPVGAGLSSSAAIECALGVALEDLQGLGFSRRQLARAGQLGENTIVGAPTGIMDQSASLLAATDSAVFLDCRSLEAEVVPLGFAAAGLELLIIDTRVAHRLVDGGYAARRADCELGASLMSVTSLRELTSADLERAASVMNATTFRRVRHVITENERVLATVAALQSTGPTAIGQLLYESHKSMRDDFEISIDELDVAVETALRHGAIGARMTGGGFGGAAIALTPISRISELTNAIFAEFESCGFARPNVFAVSAAGGAAREL